MLFKYLSLPVFFAAAVAFAQDAAPTPAAQAAPEAPAAAPAPQPPAAAPAPQAAPAGEAFKEAPLQKPAEVEKKDDNTSTISVFVKNPEEIRALQEDLKNLQTMVGDSNPEVAALLKRANHIAEMNDRCASISLNDLLDTTCARFYEVELPAFENAYMEVTGEVRLGSMRMATTLEERTRQLASCSEALTSIVISREQLLRLRGNVYLEPINFEGDFDAEYIFTLSYDPARVEQQQRLANLWIEKCGPIVLRQSGTEFAPMFIATLKVKNDSLKKTNSNVKFMLNKKNLALRIDMRRPVNGAYYLNGVRLFEKTIDADQKQSNLFFDIKNKKAVLNQPKDAEIQKFHGKEVFKKLKKMEMIGRWAWDNEKLPDEIAHPNSQDESEVMTAEDSLTYQQGLAELERALAEEREEQAAQATANEASAADAAKDAAGGDGKKRGIRWIPLAISTAVLAGGAAMAYVFNKKAKDEKEAYDAEIEGGDYRSNYEDHEKSAGDYQRNRTIGISLAIVGAVGVALSFVF
jgi:hypothetical protein